MRKWVLLGVDIFIVSISPFIALVVRDNFSPSWNKVELLIPYAVIGVGVAFLCFMVAGTHRAIWRHVSLRDFGRIVGAIVATVLITTLVCFSINRLDGVARSIPVIQCLFIIAMMSSIRLMARSGYRQKPVPLLKGRLQHRDNVLVIGHGVIAELYLRCVADLASRTIAVVGLLDETPALKGRRFFTHEIIGSPQDLPQILARFNIHGVNIRRVIVAVRFRDLSKDSQDVLLRLERMGTIELDIFEERLGFRQTHDEIEMGMSNLVAARPISFNGSKKVGEKKTLSYPLMKRGLDIVFSILLLLFLFPVFLVLSFLVAVDIGVPLTFWQQRPGRDGRPFRLYKFRTMGPAHDEDGERIPDEDRFFGDRIVFEGGPGLMNFRSCLTSSLGKCRLWAQDRFCPWINLMDRVSGLLSGQG